MNKKINCSVLLIFTLYMMTGCAQKNDHVVTIKTKYGEMVAILYDETPKHKENFIKLAKEKYFDGVLFHRVIQGFMIQGGDPDSKNAEAGKRLGNGGPGYTVEAEFSPTLFHEKGALSAARLGDNVNPTKASSGSQFYVVQGMVYQEHALRVDEMKLNQGIQQLIQKPENKALYDTLLAIYRTGDMQAYQEKAMSLKPRVEQELGRSVEKDVSPEKIKAYTTVGGAPHLDGGYTVFGKVIKGIEIIDQIAAVPTDPTDRPLEDVSMTVTVEEMPKKKIEKLYGYHYPETK